MLKKLYDAIVDEGRVYDTLEFTEEPSAQIYITEGYGVDVFIEITDDNKFKMQFNAKSINEDDEGQSEEVIVSTVQEVIEQLNGTCWDESDWQ